MSTNAVREQVFEATASQMIETGTRGLRTHKIARQAGVSEGTLFRHFRSLDQLLEELNDRCWGTVNRHIAQVAFDGMANDAKTIILRDLNTIWEMRTDQRLRLAAAGAFLNWGVTTERLESDEETRFRNHFLRLCENVVNASNSDLSATTLNLLLLSHIAIQWRYWCQVSPEQSVELCSAEAGIGVLAILALAAPSN